MFLLPGATVALMSEAFDGYSQKSRLRRAPNSPFSGGGGGHANVGDLVEVRFHTDEQESILRRHVCSSLELAPVWGG